METKEQLNTLSKDETTSLLSTLLIKHFEDDEKSFKIINDKLNEREEIAVINGQHLSYISRDINSIKDTISEHIKKVEPVILEYQDKKATVRVIAQYTKIVVGLGGLVGAILAIKEFVF